MASMTYDSSTVHSLMSLVDTHQDELSESDYIKVCNALQALNTNLTKIFPLQNVTIYTNRCHANNLENSIKLKQNELTYIKNTNDAYKKQIKDWENELNHIEPLAEKRTFTDCIKIIKLKFNIEKLEKDNRVFEDWINKLSEEITFMYNKLGYYKQLRPDHVCESEDKMYEEYIDKDLRLKSETCIRKANNTLLNSFSKIYTRINALDWIDNSNSNFICHLLDAEDEILDMVKELKQMQKYFVESS